MTDAELAAGDILVHGEMASRWKRPELARFNYPRPTDAAAWCGALRVATEPERFAAA